MSNFTDRRECMIDCYVYSIGRVLCASSLSLSDLLHRQSLACE